MYRVTSVLSNALRAIPPSAGGTRQRNMSCSLVNTTVGTVVTSTAAGIVALAILSFEEGIVDEVFEGGLDESCVESSFSERVS